MGAGPDVQPGGRRCPSCGGLVAADAEWCGQCYAPLGGDEPGDRVAAGSTGPARAPEAPGSAVVDTPGGGAVEVTGGKAAWDCPVCGERNPIETSTCPTCQTPFTRLFETPVERPEIAPRSAAMWSLAFAGLGHWKLGLKVDAIARIVLLVWTLGTVLVVLLSRPEGGGFGKAFPLFALYLLSAAAIYLVSAADAYRLAGGGPPLVSSRVLLWSSAALVLASIVLAMFVTVPAARG